MPIPRQCAILVGGLGTRLGSLTEKTPKPLLDCGGRPFLAWILRELSRFGIEEVVLLAGYQSEVVDRFCREVTGLLPKPMEIRISVEPSRAGTGGAIWYARHMLDDAFLLLNGDSWFDTNLAGFLSVAGRTPAENLGTIMVRRMDDCSRYGTVELRDQTVIGFREKAAQRTSGLISTGIYLFKKQIVDSLTDTCSLEVDVLPELARTRQLSAAVHQGYFIDIGVPEDYARAQEELKARLLRPAVFFDRDGVLNEDLGWVGTRDRFFWLPGAKEAIRFATDSGFHVFIVTNQAGVAKGFYSEEDLQILHHSLTTEVRESGGTIDDLRYCPYHPEADSDRYRRDSDCRKPQPGMIVDLLKRWGADESRSVLIGDKDSDMQAAAAANISGFLYEGGDVRAFTEDALSTVSSRPS